MKFIEEIGDWYYWDKIYLHLDTPPDQTINQKFQVKVTLEDGTVFDLKTPNVLVK
ncbi:MAG: hypothetical protein ACJA08_000447 [Cyclobacteriaceae bacterium]